jgi:hypothetical protein
VQLTDQSDLSYPFGFVSRLLLRSSEQIEVLADEDRDPHQPLDLVKLVVGGRRRPEIVIGNSFAAEGPTVALLISFPS